ncbi:fibronectin type III domain-containing protein [Methylomicrobium lacus]|uniref:fibronectin type III domain-containing protein n=1 Tax=Methylomicrobium lacus TaxID=136992 RepID=UPI0035A8E895
MKLSQHKVLIPPLAKLNPRTALPKGAALLILGINSAASIAATTTTMVPSGITAPLNGFVASGSAINPSTGTPFRHLWVSDHLQGLCRIDPDLDTAATLPPGSAAINSATCTTGGPAVYDPQGQKVYIADDVANKLNKGVVRQKFLPTGGGGHGTVDGQATRLGDASSCGVPSNRPSSMAMGPDGNLYLGFFKSGNILRIRGPGDATVPCSSFQTIGAGTDGKRTLGLAWINHALYGLDGGFPWIIANADKCVTAANPGSCTASSIFTTAAIIPSGIGSNQLGATPNGTTLYISDAASVTKIDDPNGTAQITKNWATGMSLPSSINVDTAAVSVPDVFIADDPTAGAGQLQGRIYTVSEQITPTAPGTPTNVSAKAGDSVAVVNWTPGPNGSAPTSSYTVHEFVPPDLVNEVGSQTTTAASPVPTTLTVTGLANGTAYAFKVSATNSVGTSALSEPATPPVTPQAALPPDAPQGLTGTSGNAAAALAWQPPISDGGSPITSYTVEYTDSITLKTLSVPGNVTGTTITGLTNGTLYTAQVHAVNAVGPGPYSNTVNLNPTGAAASLDLALSMSGPAEVQSGADAVYSLLVTNTGGLPVPQVRVDNILPAGGFGSASFSTTRGACLPLAGTNLTCNLGPMNPGQTGTVTVTLTNVTTTVTDNASVAAYQADGLTQLDDALPVDNTGSVTTSIAPPPPAPQTTTDVQISGSASNGGPQVNTGISYTFQVRNGTDVANDTVFNAQLPSTLKFTSASAGGNVCGGTTVAGQLGGSVVCNLGNLAAKAQSSITINVTPTVVGDVSTTGSVTFNGTDPNPSNNSKTVTLTVKP